MKVNKIPGFTAPSFFLLGLWCASAYRAEHDVCGCSKTIESFNIFLEPISNVKSIKYKIYSIYSIYSIAKSNETMVAPHSPMIFTLSTGDPPIEDPVDIKSSNSPIHCSRRTYTTYMYAWVGIYVAA